MNIRLVLAWLHLLALAIGLAGVWGRARALRDSLRNPEDPRAITRAFVADTWWGVAAAGWLITGLWRLFGSTEKTTSYYFGNHAFLAKMGLFLIILALEIWPMMTLIAWRRRVKEPNARDAGRIEIISYVECALVVIMVFAAVSMARGFGMKTAPVVASVETTAEADTVPSIEPSGVETTTSDDVALLQREIAMPLDGVNPATLHSNFNERRGGGTRPHEALDMMAPRRTPIKSAATGRVLKLFTSKAGGLMIYAADSSERFILMYAHLDGYAPGLHDGSAITRGELIGFVGSTGNASASAPHLHFAIARSADVKHWSKGKPLDPLGVLQGAAK